jgi:hypothetical protein
MRTLWRLGLGIVTSCALSGCSFAAAPSFELFGAFFPAWMICALIGIFGAAAARVLLTSRTLDDTIPFELALCTAVGVIVSLIAWALLFR